METENLLRQLQKLKTWDLFITEESSRPVEFENNHLKRIEQKQSRSAALRVVDEGKIGFSATAHPDHTDALVDRACASAKYGQTAAYEYPAAKEIPKVECYDSAIAETNTDHTIEMGQGIIESILAEHPQLKIAGTIETATITTTIHLPGDVQRQYQATDIGFSFEALDAKEGDLLWLSDSLHVAGGQFDPMNIAHNIKEQARMATQNSRIAAGKYPVIFTPQALPALWEAFMQGLNGKMVQKGVSPLKGRIGEEISGTNLTMIDDPLLPMAPGSRPFDDEGTISRKIPLIEQGVLRNFVFDLQTAGIMKTESTASAVRSATTPPAPGFSTLTIEPGNKSLGEMIESIDEGLIVYQPLGGGQSNLLMGEFSLNIGLGFKIERGKIVGRVKNTMVAGNVYETFRRVQGISEERQMYSGCLSPAFLFDAVPVASAE